MSPFAAVLAVIFFGIAEIFHLTRFSDGTIDVTAFELAGLICVALALLPAWPWRRP
jgi:hypothetical protein